MYIIIWQYEVNPAKLEAFIEHYHAGGVWANFFQSSPDYFGTEFYQVENKNQFITIDKWMSEAAYQKFLQVEKEKYNAIDKRCEGFTTEETLVDKFYLLEI